MLGFFRKNETSRAQKRAQFLEKNQTGCFGRYFKKQNRLTHDFSKSIFPTALEIMGRAERRWLVLSIP
jgi:hypothetical protein